MMKLLCALNQTSRTVLGILFIMLWISNLPQAYSQGKIPRVMFEPSPYLKPTIRILENYNPFPAEQRSKDFWIVFSDRQGNKTYTDATCKIEMATIDFLDKFLVVEESGQYIHIAQDKEWDGTDEYLSKGWKDFGWIHKKYMLLSKMCLRNDKNITLKAMVINDEEAMKEAFHKGDNQSTVFYSDPVKKIKNSNQSNLFTIFFVYKKEGDFYLISKTDGITDDATVKTNIYGWVNKKQLNVWNTRNAWEPNSRQNAVDERRSRGIKTSTFSTFTQAQHFRETMRADTVQWASDPFEERKGGEFRRFPILNRENGIVKLSVYGGFNPKDVIFKARTSKAINKKCDKARHFNLVFVVDGTYSMKPYFDAIVRGISESINKLSQDHPMRFGAVVYRDFAEGPYLAETIPLTAFPEEFKQNLLRTWSDDKNRYDTDEPEAVNYGLKQALTTLDIPEDETNILILVGDAGNHDRNDLSQVSDDEIIRLLYEKNINFMVFQVANQKDKPSYVKFQIAAKNLIMLAEKKRYNFVKGVGTEMGVTLDKPSWDDVGNFTWKLKNASMIGYLIYSEPGKKLQTDLLQYEIAEIVEKAPLETEKWLNALSKVVDDGIGFTSVTKSMPKEGKYTSDFEQTMLFTLAKTLNADFTPEELEALKDNRYEYSKTGYSPERCIGLKENLYEPVVFLTYNEFSQLITSIAPLVLEAGTTNEKRKAMSDVWNQILAGHLGEARKGISIQEAMIKVTGLPSKSSFIDSVKVEDIIDEIKFPTQKFNRWLDQIKKKYDKLNKYYQNDEFPYKFSCNGSKFYWIEESDLP